MEEECLTVWPAQSSSTPLFPSHDTRMRALLIDDEEQVLGHLRSVLQNEGFIVSGFAATTDAVEELRRGLSPDIALIKARMQGRQDIPALRWFRQISPMVPTIALSCSNDPRIIVNAVKMGAIDVLVQPFDRADLRYSLKQCKLALLAGGQRRAREITLSPNSSLIVCSDAMKSIISQCELLAPSDLPVLILGETGTGKEVIAQYIHKMSTSADAPFLKVNCAAMPTDLLESELLGYEQGAFTGATKAKPGKFELCDRGTIFLDEIGEMSPALQAKLLQVLQDGTFSRLGGRSTIKVSVRVISATNIDIKRAIRERRFRDDLYYRINGYTVYLPPLRERREEIPVLIRYFMQRMAEKYARRPVVVSDNLLAICRQYSWPGNLRELESFVKRLLVIGDDQVMMDELASSGVPPLTSPASGDAMSVPIGGLKKMLNSVKGDAEARVIAAALQENQWKRKKTAAELKISYKALLYKMRQYGIIAPSCEPSC
jgi:two-component system response regulator AtoC